MDNKKKDILEKIFLNSSIRILASNSPTKINTNLTLVSKIVELLNPNLLNDFYVFSNSFKSGEYRDIEGTSQAMTYLLDLRDVVFNVKKESYSGSNSFSRLNNYFIN